VVEGVAQDLGNTPTVARASYIHPKVITSFTSGELASTWADTPPRKARLTLDERRTRALLSSRSKRRSAPPERVDEPRRRAG
jgi:DNA topoisomerase IB